MYLDSGGLGAEELAMVFGLDYASFLTSCRMEGMIPPSTFSGLPRAVGDQRGTVVVAESEFTLL